MSSETAFRSNTPLTPMLQQYLDVKKECPEDAVLLFRMGDFFEAFFKDAEIISRELHIQLTARDKGTHAAPMAGVPHHSVESYIHRLVQRGYVVALCDQIEPPKKGQKLVKRAITRIITPGTLSDLSALEPHFSNFLATVEIEGTRVAISLVDMLAGDVLLLSTSLNQVADELHRLSVKEVITQPAHRLLLKEALQHHKLYLGTYDIENEGLTTAQLIQWLSQRFSRMRWDGMDTPLRDAQIKSLYLACRYIENTQRLAHIPLQTPRRLYLQDFLILDETTRKNLELQANSVDSRREGSVLWHLDQCSTPMGSRLLAQWLNFPLRQLTVLQMRLDIVEYFVQERSLREELRRYLASIRDIERIVGRIALGRAQPTCLALLRQGLQVLPHIKSVINDSVPHLGKRWQQINILSDLTELLQSALVEQPVRHLHTGAVFKPEYSEALSALQELTENHDAILQKMQEAERASTGINNLKITYNRVFGYTIEVSKGQSHRVPEHYQRKQTLVNAERYTTQALVDLEHKILAAETEKSVLEASLYTDLLQKIKHYIPELRVLMKLLARTDVLLNFAYIAEEYRYTRPQLQEEPILNLKQSRHPVVERLLPADSPYVPGDLSLAANDQYIMLLTGPNMGGKSTFMRQAALNIILAQMGCFVPAQYARIGLCDRLFTRVGASDHLGRGQSTFMVEMLETATILRAATAKSFVVLDEIGRGTSTFDGMALAWSVLEYIHQTLGCRTLFATHYHELTDLPQQYSGMFNACVQAIKHQQELVFSHQVALGIAQHSFGIEVAAMAGLPNAVIHRAASIAHAWDKHATPLSLPTATEHTDVVLQQQQQQPAAYLSIEKRLMEIDPLSLTPMEALHTLCEIKELYQQSLSSPKS